MIVAILGGGYYTYKSFAASVTWTWEPGGTAVDIKKSGSCSNSIYKEPSKNNKQVWNIACGKNKGTVTIASKNAIKIAPGTYRTCAFVKGAGQVALTTDINVNFMANVLSGGSAINVSNDGAYHEYCSNSIYYGVTPKSLTPAFITPSFIDTWMNVSYFQLQKL